MSESPKPHGKSAGLRRLLSYFGPYKKGLALALVLMAISSAIPGALVLFIEKILDDVLIEKDRGMLALMPLAIVTLYATNGLVSFSRGMLTRSIAWKVVTQLRSQLFEALLRQDVAWHQSRPTGALLARLTNDVNNIQYGVSGIVTAVEKPLTLIILIVTAFVMNAKLAILAVIALPIIIIPIDRFGRRLRTRTRESLDNLADLSASATETLSGIRTVHAFGAEEQRRAAFEEQNHLQKKLQLQAFAARLLPSPIIELIAALGVGLVIWVGGQQVFSGEVKPGELIAFLVCLGLLNDPLKGLAKIQSLSQQGMAGAEAVFEVLDREPVIVDEGTTPLPSGPLELRFEGVGFDYGDGPVLEGLDLEIAAGKMIALVGASGSGKSTTASLIPRFHDVTHGRVLLGGVDLREVPLASLRAHVGLVSQDPFLFNDTVHANILLGRPGASEEEIQRAAKVANAHDFIMALPLGYETRIDELGQRLSGGQRQRICIARAVLKDAPVLVLDEATSSLDAESEALVQEALERLMSNRTVLAIAHRLSTIREADEILVLNQGRVVERGSHGELLDREGDYARLVRRQEGS
jgi:subfamily B ATP-binding cassette protein MsbA